MFIPTFNCVENVTNCCLAAGTNSLISLDPVWRQEPLHLAVFWQIVSLEVVYVAGWCAERRGSAASTYTHPLISQ